MRRALTGDREAGGRREERGWAPISSSDGGGREGGKLSTPSGVLASVVPLFGRFRLVSGYPPPPMRRLRLRLRLRR